MIPDLLNQCQGDGFCRFGIYLGCAAAVIAIWLGGMLATAVIGGWKRLAEIYGVPEGYGFPEGEQLNWVSGVLKKRFPMNYNNALTLTFSPEGLGLVPAFIWRTGHARLLIPWKDLRLTEKQRMFTKVLEVQIADTGYVFSFWGKGAVALQSAYYRFQRG
ncbi:MAG TPA: hypothetical protein VEF76_09515 [Patescibacteria group bacterium]|nr:hypothetical protein [Patescibacteria group bacterium]